MEVLLGLPVGAVPELTVTLVAAGHGVGSLVDLQLGGVLEGCAAVTAPPVRLVVLLWTQVASPSRGREVVLRLMISCRVEHGASAVTARAHLHRLVVPRNQLRIEPITSPEARLVHHE